MHSLFGRKAMTNLDSILKSRHYFANKCPYSQSYGFSSSHVWMWEVDNKKMAELQRIDAFELWHWRRLLRVPWTARRSNQSILKTSTLNIHWKNWCWSWSFNILTTHEELTHWKRVWCWEMLRAGGEGVKRKRLLDDITDLTDINLSKLWVMMKDREAWLAAAHGGPKESQTSEQLNNSSLISGPTIKSIHDYRKNHSFDDRDFCLQSYVFDF